ncbi:enediyne polyketide synthase [Actinokineospora baliensis]|uniref:type I polyketide synthase n=1 Tax=Actinokineospora baliensis TaxID=547056 RepID=UPI0019580519|nr:type I polyketide synthase [Actinokineospora baliensis]MBM7774512.1 enediyne polyketide synthase [Actinokineospora baliensis]
MWVGIGVDEWKRGKVAVEQVECSGGRDSRIAVVGIGVRYPDADSPAQLWETVLAGRRAFRRLPEERMSHADYFSPDPAAPDRFYAATAAVLRDFEFDRVRYQVAGSTYRSTDLTHWLALDTAARALADAGFPDGEGLPRASTGVVIGNSLTGEFSRANVLRLRWPYVRRTVAAALAERGWAAEDTAALLREVEGRYKAPFPPIDEDSLAGGLANTIAGRICNHFDLRGGGYTVDGACSSSLLSVATAAKALVDGELDVAVAGGVDLSIDPFEVIGFAKTGALATGEMKVYDRDSNGFWPGEGCGVLVLMREADAVARGGRIYATVTGWGVSSDGRGGITRPEAGGHRLALQRAYRRAGYGVESVSYFEGHGTGTALGDATEIDALSSARLAADPGARPAALGTVKGNFGHTKAAAGVAGLVKAVLAVHHQVIPPGTGHHDPHPRLLGESAALYVPSVAQLWPADQPVRAGVSAMGFGGINTHVAVEQAPGVQRRSAVGRRTTALVTGRQDAELLLFDGDDPARLRAAVARAAELAPRLSQAEVADLAAELAVEASGRGYRAAVVATGPLDAHRKLLRLLEALDAGEESLFVPQDGVFLGVAQAAPRIAFLFPGQGSGRGGVGAMRRRFTVAEDVFGAVPVPLGGDQVATEVAQPRIVAGSLAAVRVLGALGVDAAVAVGHSLGEVTALGWAGAVDGGELLRLAATRGRIMAEASRGGGAMAGLAADPERTRRLVGGEDVVIAGFNGPTQTVVAGLADAVERVCAAAAADGVTATRINVSHAFHSPLVRPAAEAMERELAGLVTRPLTRDVVSSVTAGVLDVDTDVRALLCEQVLRPVRFHEAAQVAVTGADLAVEVGPGRVLAGLVEQIAPGVPVLSTDTDSASLVPLLSVVAAAYAVGSPVDTTLLFAGRALRPLPLDGGFTFLANPCETAPELEYIEEPVTAEPVAERTGVAAESTLELLRRLAAERVELPLDTVRAQTHPLDDLHLSSITVGQIVNEVTRELGRPPLVATPNFATVSLGELAELIDELAETAHEQEPAGEVPGVAPWVHPFAVTRQPQPRPEVVVTAGSTQWTVFAPDGHPLAEPLRAALAESDLGDGVLLCLPASGERHPELILAAGRAALAGARLVVAHGRYGAAGLARTLHLEAPAVAVTVVELADPEPATAAGVRDAVTRVVEETALTTGYTEAHYATDGTRTVPAMAPLPTTHTDGVPALTADDVVLVTGGGKGITAECALAMAADSGARLALLGRADPATDTELAANLARMTAAGIEVRYARADVTDPALVAAAVDTLVADLGPVTAVLHGAGGNDPAALASLTDDAFARALAPKVDGLRAVLDALDTDRIRLLVTFGSIIGRAGLRGEAHYATANDWLTELTVEFGRTHPAARVLALEWSVWSGAGMGERLGVVEALLREGITPISVDNGIAVLRRVLADPAAGPVLVISGRMAGLPTLRLPRPELPLRRFAERVLAHYPGVELVTEADLASGSDPYLDDHLLDGDLLMPAVLGMEAMAQIAGVLTGHDTAPLLRDVVFARPIAVRPGSSTTIRIAALVTGPGTVEVVIRCAETGYGADHFRATLHYPRPEPDIIDDRRAPGLPVIPVDPITELYGGLLFQGKRFQRLQAYRLAGARRAVAEIAAGTQPSWFAPFLPQTQVLADPGTRDTAMHAIQACVPDATLLPQRVDRLYLAHRDTQDVDYVVLDAVERAQDGDSYTYDLDLCAPDGTLVERWEGLVLRAVRHRDPAGPWVPFLLGSIVERALERVIGGSRAVVVEPDGTDGARREKTQLAVSRALGEPVTVRHRPDGRPELAERSDLTVSASHGAGLTVAVVGAGRLACDVEAVHERPWSDLLGAAQLPVRDLLAAEAGEDTATASTRVWCALECLRKSGATTQALTVDRVHGAGWVVLSAGDALIATWVTTVRGGPDPVVFAVLVGKEH